MNNTELSRRVAEIIELNAWYDNPFGNGEPKYDFNGRRQYFDITTAEAQIAFEDWLIDEGFYTDHAKGDGRAVNQSYGYYRPTPLTQGYGKTRLEAIRAVVEAFSK